MKAVTVRLSPAEFRLLELLKKAGFSTSAEIIKCASMSYAEAADKAERRRKATKSDA